jgi:hypothetical protein
MIAVNLAKPREAARLVFDAARNSQITMEEFRNLLPLIDAVSKCEICHGESGDTPGNENWVNGVCICDFCAAAQEKEATTIYLRWCNDERTTYATYRATVVKIKDSLRARRVFDSIHGYRCGGQLKVKFTEQLWDDLCDCKEVKCYETTTP